MNKDIDLQHRHISFLKFDRPAKHWVKPSLTPIRLTAQELKEARSSPEQFLVVAKRLKAEGRL